jgi:hypothetical protein
MDRAETLRRLDALIEPDGAVVLFEADHPELPDNTWLVGHRELLERYSGDDPARAVRRSADWVRHEAILLDSPFARLERVGIIERRRVPAGRLVDRASSQSSTSRARLGERADQLLVEIDAFLAGVAPAGLATEVVESTALVARRPASSLPPPGPCGDLSPRCDESRGVHWQCRSDYVQVAREPSEPRSGIRYVSFGRRERCSPASSSCSPRGTARRPGLREGSASG